MKAPSTYEAGLEWNLAQWVVCVNQRKQLFDSALEDGERCSAGMAHILMENWFMAAEHVVAYEKALGKGLTPADVLAAASAGAMGVSWQDAMRGAKT